MLISSPEITGIKDGSSSFEPRAYRINDACKILQISRSHLYALTEKEQLRLIKIGGRSLVPASEIERLLNGEAS